MNANEILKKHEDANEMHFHEVDRKWIIEAMEEYAALRQPPVSGSLLNDCVYYNLSDRAMCPNKNVCVNCQKQ